ncbi:MAG: hypothetical protein WBA76_15030 [Phormidesmis sp.]
MKTSLPAAFSRLGHRLQSGDLHHTVGRFKAARETYSFYQGCRQQLNAEFYKRRLTPRGQSFLTDVLPERCAQELQQQGVSFGLQLPPADIEAVYQFACETPCREPGFEDEFYAQAVENGRLTGDRPHLAHRRVFRGLVQNPGECPVIKKVAQDPTLLEIVHKYLRYWPSKVVPHLTWSFVSDLPVAQQKELYPPLNYHYDVAGYNFMTAYFYITDIDKRCGPHVMIATSHNKKPKHTLFSSYAELDSEEQMLDYYGKENKLVIEGKAGFGYVQDPSCFHRLVSPVKSRRLLLQIRYA